MSEVNVPLTSPKTGVEEYTQITNYNVYQHYLD